VPNQLSASIICTSRASVAGSWISFWALKKMAPNMPPSCPSFCSVARYFLSMQ
jgi:hypothetical protein